MNDAERAAYAENELLNKLVHFDNAGSFDIKIYNDEMWTHRATSNSNGVKLWIQYLNDDGTDDYAIDLYSKKSSPDVQAACNDFKKKYSLDYTSFDSIAKACSFIHNHKNEFEELFGGVVKRNTLTASKIARELMGIARELTAGRRRMAWKVTENGGINDEYAYIVLDGTLEKGELVTVLQDGEDLLFKCGDYLKDAVIEYLPEKFRERARKAWSPNFLEFLPSYFAGKDCVGYPIAQLGISKEDIEEARNDEEAGVEYYTEEEQMSEREKKEREFEQKIESLTREIGKKSKEIGRLKGTITSMKKHGMDYRTKQREYENRIKELEKQLGELEDLTGESYDVEDVIDDFDIEELKASPLDNYQDY